jgi:hypothetical protein
MDSHSELSRGEGVDAQHRRKDVILTKAELQYWDSIKEEVMAQAQFAKFSQNPELRQLLLDTRDAELWHGAPRQPRARIMSLERVRAALRAGLTELPAATAQLDADSEDEA